MNFLTLDEVLNRHGVYIVCNSKNKVCPSTLILEDKSLLYLLLSFGDKELRWLSMKNGWTSPVSMKPTAHDSWFVEKTFVDTQIYIPYEWNNIDLKYIVAQTEKFDKIMEKIDSGEKEMKTTENKALELLRNLFVDAQNAGVLRDVWNLATALRGPDEEGRNEDKKTHTTPIRQCLLTRNMATNLNLSQNGDYAPAPKESLPPSALETKTLFGHYDSHILNAANVIGTKEELSDKVNVGDVVTPKKNTRKYFGGDVVYLSGNDGSHDFVVKEIDDNEVRLGCQKDNEDVCNIVFATQTFNELFELKTKA